MKFKTSNYFHEEVSFSYLSLKQFSFSKFIDFSHRFFLLSPNHFTPSLMACFWKNFATSFFSLRHHHEIQIFSTRTCYVGISSLTELENVSFPFPFFSLSRRDMRVTEGNLNVSSRREGILIFFLHMSFKEKKD